MITKLGLNAFSNSIQLRYIIKSKSKYLIKKNHISNLIKKL